MARVRVWLGGVKCRDTEDTTGRDSFYLVGFASDGVTTTPVLTKPVDINDDEWKDLEMEDRDVVFDADIPEDRVMKIGFAAYDKDSKGDWEDYGGAVTELGKVVGGALALTGNPIAVTAGALLPFAIAGVGEIMKLDKDDALGSYTTDIPVAALQNGRETTHQWILKGKPVPWWSEWDYTVTFSVSKGTLRRERVL